MIELLEQLPEVATIGGSGALVGGGGALFLLGWLAKTASRVATAVHEKWDKDRQQQLVIANHFARAFERALRLASSRTRRDEASDADTDPTEFEAMQQRSGPIRVTQEAR